MNLDGATVLVTGASSGIGAALAPMLAERGATVVAVARRADRLAGVVDRCREHTPASQAWVADLGDTDAAEAVARRAVAELGGLDALVNNAGAPMRRRVTDITLDEIRRTMALNFESPVRMTLAVLPHMLERDRGVIVNVASFAGRVGVLGEGAYSASKFALCGWSESMAAELWHTGVEVRLVLPGAIDTEIWDQPGNDAPLYDGPLEPAGNVAAGIVAAVEGDRIEHYLPDMRAIVEIKTSDLDGFLAGMVALADGKDASTAPPGDPSPT